MDKLTAERRLRKVAGAFLLAGALPGAILVAYLPATFLISVPGAIAYLFIFRKWRGDERHLDSANGWLLAIAINAIWLVVCTVSASHGGFEILGIVMSAFSLAVAMVGMRAQRQFSHSEDGND